MTSTCEAEMPAAARVPVVISLTRSLISSDSLVRLRAKSLWYPPMIQTGCCVVIFGSLVTLYQCSCQAGDEVRLGRRADLGFGDTGCTLHQQQAFVCDIDDGQVGDDAV